MKRKNLFVLMFSLVFCLNGIILAEEQTKQASASGEAGKDAQSAAVLTNSTEQTKQAAAATTGETTETKQITALDIKGNKSISTTVILSKIKARPGILYSKNIISDDVKRLYATGFFSEVNVDLESYQDGFKLIITVVEKPIIDKINFTGNKQLRTETLKDAIKSKETQYLDYPTLKEDIEKLKTTYKLKGFSDASIDQKVDINSQTNKATVSISIKEGKRIKIKKITFEGNKSYTSKRILKLMKTRAAALFNAGFLKEEVLTEDMEKIQAFYKREGFNDVKAEYEIQYDPKAPFLYIKVKIQEGKKYLVGNVGIKGNIAVSEKDIRAKLIDCLPRKAFSEDALQADLSKIQGVYFDKGYIFAEVKPTTSLNPDTGCVDVSYNITENDIAYVNKIKIRGNNKTKDLVVRRELRIHPGDRFDGEKLRRSKERLQNLGFFDEINYDYESTNEPNKKDLVVEVKETKTGEFSFGGGYSTVDKLIGFIAIEQKNFDWRNFPYFTGGGQDLKLRAEVGTITQEYMLSFTDPWVFDYPVLFGFDGYRYTHDKERDVGYGYTEKRTGGDIRLGKEITEYLRADSMYKLEGVSISDVDDSATDDLKKEIGSNIISKLDFGLTFDTRDNVFSTTKGAMLNGVVGVAGGIFGGDKDFSSFTFDGSQYFPVIKSCVLEFRARAGVIGAYSDTDHVPIYERFFAGGANTIRGYNERKIGPIDPVTSDPLGGESMFVANIEYTVPLVEFIKGAIFFDTGNVWAKVKDFGAGGFKSGTGIGIRVKTPLGPLRLDYGYPLNIEPGKESRQGRFHFNMSHNF